MMRGAQPARARSARSRCSPTGPTASPPAKCRRRRRGRRASSATSSSPSGTGPIRRRICTTRSRPTAAIRRLNANGLIYGSLELSADYLPVLDPVHNTISQVPLTVRDPTTPPRPRRPCSQPSPYWGDEADLDEQEQRPQPDVRRAGPRVDHVDGPPARQSGVLQGGIDSSVGEAVPARTRSGRQLAMYDPKTKKLTHISTCFSTHHLMFAEDANHTLWTSGGGQVVGWLNTKMFDETQRRGEVAGLDGAHPRHQRQRQARRLRRARTSRSIRPRTSAIGGGVLRRRAGARRIDLGIGARLPRRHRPAEPGREPAGDRARRSLRAAVEQPGVPVQGFSPRGMDVDRNGVVWAALASGHLASFDRRKCKGPLNGPNATGQHCPEGWTLLRRAAAAVEGRHRVGQRRSQLLHVGRSVRHARAGREHADQHRQRVRRAARAEGRQVGRAARAVSDWASTPSGWTAASTIRTAGWKGRGLWATVSTRAPFHMETGKGTTSKVMHFQLRPDPLAK